MTPGSVMNLYMLLTMYGDIYVWTPYVSYICTVYCVLCGQLVSSIYSDVWTTWLVMHVYIIITYLLLLVCRLSIITYHLFLACPFAIDCWASLGRIILIAQLQFPFFMEIIVTMCWSIWAVRNDQIFRDIQPCRDVCRFSRGHQFV